MDEGLNSQASPQAARQGLSALLDGEHEPHELGMVCQAWRDDAELRRTWHAYSLIGDVLRSDDLAQEAARDAAFLARLRSRMAEEPVVLAPAAAPPSPVAAAAALPNTARAQAFAPSMRRSWGAPLAMAAGVVTVVGVAVMMRGLAPAPDAGAMAAARPASGGVAVAVREAGVASPVDAPTLVRNPDLDRYLNAHRQYGGAGVIGAPGGFRQVAASPADR